MESASKSDKDKPEPWICGQCGNHMFYHTLKPTGCGYKAVCPPKALEAALSAHETKEG